MELKYWSEEDFEDLDRKFDALCEHLGIEFVFERVSDGSDSADRERVYVRKIVKEEPELPTVTPTPELPRPASVAESVPYEKPKRYKKGYEEY